MAIFKRKPKNDGESIRAVPLLAGDGARKTHPFSSLESYIPFSAYEFELYRTLREAVPVIDAAIYKTVRLTGGFKVASENEAADAILKEFQDSICSDSGSVSLQSFIDTYFEQLLTYGTAIAEILTDSDGRAVYLYNASIKNLSLKRNPKDFRKILVCRNDSVGETVFKNQEKLVFSTLNASPGELMGNSILKGLPFVSSVLLRIFNAIGENWERVGNLRFAVTYKPNDDGASKAYAKERAMQIAEEWGAAMKSGEVRDFIAVGDVDIKVIGADNQILDSEVPVRQLLEQIVAKLSLPPFMLGLSWSTTERMSQQQADALTTELEHYRRILTPVIVKICKTHLKAFGFTSDIEVVWDDIMLKDTLDDANARYLNAQADALILENSQKGGNNE